ncbi:MAG TPA: hypothetical protein VFE78_05585, partial [Gemmataceae bacterium]|nr:hypothetical protein [Gemmataceae bacterium]
FPVVLTFDRGDGKEPVKKELLDGTYRVGIDVASNLMDLFPGSAPLLADASDPSTGAAPVPPAAVSPDDASTIPPSSPLNPPPAPAPAPVLGSAGAGG